MAKHLKSFWSDESGSTAIEYALIAVIVGVGLVAALSDFSTAVVGYFNDVAEKF